MSNCLMNFTTSSARIKSNWFERGIIKRISPKGLMIYLSLFRYLVNNQEHKYTFITCVDIMKKNLPSSYTKEDIVNSLKLMQSEKIIKITNLSRWDQLVVGKNIESSKTLIIVATDPPNLKEIDGKLIPVSDDDWFTPINLPMINYFQRKHTLQYEELSCYYTIVMKYWTADVCNVAYDKMELWTGLDKNTMQRTALKAELMGLVRIRNEKRGKKTSHQHYFCDKYELDYWRDWFKRNGEEIEDHVRKRNGRKQINKNRYVLSDKQTLEEILFATNKGDSAD